MTDAAPDIAPPLRMVFWESTSRCNLSCLHCRRCDVAEDLGRFDLPPDAVRAMLEDLARTHRPVFVFSGGEPLMRPDWAELAAHATQLGLPVALATNGTLVDAPTARRVRDAGFARASISLDGADADTHDAFRRLPGSFDAAIAGARRLREAGVDLQINSTIARHNRGQLDALYGLALELGAVALHLFLLVPVGCGVEIEQSHRITPEQYEAVLEWVCDRQEGSPLHVRATCAPHYFRIAAQRRAARGRTSAGTGSHPASRLRAATRGCLAGISVAFVSHRGDVLPCGYFPRRAGSVCERPLSEIWRNSELFAELREYGRLKGRCGACDFKSVCGGCRARALSASGDYLAEEPMCSYEPPATQAGR